MILVSSEVNQLFLVGLDTGMSFSDMMMYQYHTLDEHVQICNLKNWMNIHPAKMQKLGLINIISLLDLYSWYFKTRYYQVRVTE